VEGVFPSCFFFEVGTQVGGAFFKNSVDNYSFC